MNPQNPEGLLCHADHFRPAAEDAARQLIRSWTDYGPREPNTIDPDTLPGVLAEVGKAVLDATLGEGLAGFPGVLGYFTGAPDGIRGEFIECCQGNGPHPKDCGPLLDRIRRWNFEHRKDMLTHRLIAAREAKEDTAEILREFAALEAEGVGGNHSLRERAYCLRFNPDETPPPDEMCMVIGDIPIAARGNLTVPQGKSKVGKTAVVSAVLGAAHRGEYQTTGDTLCIEWRGKATGAIIHMDTEQSRADWHALVCRGITRSGIPKVSPRLVSLPLVRFSRSERLSILKQTLAYESERQGTIDLVMIDGVADLCVSPNDEAEALELVSQIHALAQEYDCPVFCVLHENPGSKEAKTRGHLGSELNRKAFANLRIDKDAETSVSTIYGTDMRKRDIPREQGFCFAWDTAAGMHTFQGRAAGLKAAQTEFKAIEKARAEWEPIYDFAAENRTNGACPFLTAQEAADIETDMKPTGKKTNAEAMRKRMERAEILGVLRRIERGQWALNRNGQTGHETDKRKMSEP
jgi:hypothetical protein